MFYIFVSQTHAVLWRTLDVDDVINSKHLATAISDDMHAQIAIHDLSKLQRMQKECNKETAIASSIGFLRHCDLIGT